MALTKISRGLLDTGVSDSSDATSITIDSSERVGINQSSPAARLHVFENSAEIARFEGNDEYAYIGLRGTVGGSATSLGYFGFANDTGTAADLNITNSQNGDISFKANSAERMKITSSGEVGIGTSSPTSGRNLHIYSSTQDALKVEVATAINQIELMNSSNSPTYITQDSYGLQIKADENGWGGTNSFFSVKVKATERLRIFSDGNTIIRPFSGTNQVYDGGKLQVTSAGDMCSMYVANTGFASHGTMIGVERGATSSYSFAQYYSGRRPDTGGGDREFNFRGDGNAYADGSFNNSGADYAEYFESHTGSAIPRGTSVVLENNKVRAATSEDDVADIIGVVRPKEFGKNSMVVGNTAWNMWSQKYLTDDFNCYVMEDYSVVSWYEYRDENDDEGTLVTYESDKIPSDVTVPDDAETNTHDENGVKFQRRALNPDFDASLTYEPREERDEWVIVGLIGQVQILDGQPTNDRWIKMRDISDTVEEWYIR